MSRLKTRGRSETKLVEIQVNFQNDKRAMAHIQKILERSLGISYMVPDRVTGLQALEELRQLCPGRVWNFVSYS